MDEYMLTTDTVTTMLTTDTQPRTHLHDVSWAVFDFACLTRVELNIVIGFQWSFAIR